VITDKRSLTLPLIVLNTLVAHVKSCEEWKPFIAMIAVNFAFAIVNILLKKILDEGMDHGPFGLCHIPADNFYHVYSSNRILFRKVGNP
jgi:hypothetical protein